MRILVLGAGGMLGHKLVQRLCRDFPVSATLRGDGGRCRTPPTLAGARTYCRVDGREMTTVLRTLDDSRPDMVINCIGIVKQRDEAKEPIETIAINALFPHLLARLCAERAIRVLHFSTDCVFSGRRGPYREDDFADADDLYGRTKFLGELAADHCLTLRTSIVGRELAHHAGLIEWFLAQRGRRINGFAGALYTGLTTNALADVVAVLLTRFPHLSGLFHVASEPISKFDLLRLVNEVYQAKVEIVRDDDFFCDRRLDGGRFLAATGIAPPAWRRMIEDMRSDENGYQLPGA